ncbi:Cation efflux system protein CzcA [Nitrospira sp. KM1]|uniref:efflux RND transporter permease subunit n=1 Tax=Nitrospira sp. KM1 TaxID=1936990 RepID=UPI0013A73106|nr:CusA/CzcA family heavy metal efflux RND transporter [Nitrospira sp. KM1]BCA54511.1 Cation efflux system protein CzcA [Nitrospira sp. KM1]
MDSLFLLSLRYRFFTLVCMLLVITTGLWSFAHLTIDAMPDLTPVQVQVLTRSPALGPVEIEQLVTFPIEASLAGLPGLHELRSVSRYGLSAVTAIFEDHADIYRARQLVTERLTRARVPPEYGKPLIGPLTTGLGEVYQFTLKGAGYSPMVLRTMLEWDIGMRLRTIPGVVEVNIWGGEEQQYHVIVEPAKLLSYKVSLPQVFNALERNNALVGGGYIEHEREQVLIRGEALAQTATDLGRIIVAHGANGVPILIRDVAQVKEGPALRIGAATALGDGETVIGMVQMLAGENAQQIVERVKIRVQEIQATLPAGVSITPYYDRTRFVDQVIRTVRNNLLEGGLLVVAVLFLFLGNLAAGLIVASAIPLSMLFAFTGMVATGFSGNLMSLGAIDFGLLVDGSVVMIDNILRRMTLAKPESAYGRKMEIEAAGREVLRPMVFAVGIIIAVYLPILALTGIEGKLFRPMALTVIFALAGSVIVAVAVTPVLALWSVRPTHRDGETYMTRLVRRVYTPLLTRAMKHPAKLVAGSAFVFLVSVGIASTLGVEFVPRLDEGDFAINVWRLPSVSLSESVATSIAIERVLRTFPEVVNVVTRTGSPEVATDVMGIELSDVFAILQPMRYWQSAQTRDELIAKMQAAIRETVPGVGLGFTQPIEMRFNELIAGSRSDLAIKLFGDDLDILRQRADAIAQVIERIRGAADVRVEQISGLPLLRVIVDRDQIARYGLTAEDVLTVVETSRTGHVVGTVIQGVRRFDLVVRLSEHISADPKRLGGLLIPTMHGELVPLSRVAEIQADTGPAQISRQDVQRRILVECNVRGRDLGSFVMEAQREVSRSISLPVNYYVRWGGQYQHLQEASSRLLIVIPLTLLLILSMLSVVFGSIRPAWLIFFNVPLALSGGVLALWIRGLPLSISAAIGFIALFGIAVLNGVVLVSHIRNLEAQGTSTETAINQGAMDRVRPVLMTALVAGFGFLPMAFATSMGAEVQRPLATVVIGGVATSTALTLLVIPALYRRFCRPQLSADSFSSPDV